MAIENMERDTNMNKKTIDRNINSEGHSLSSSSRSDSYAFTNFTNKDKKKLRKTPHKRQRET